MVKSKKGCSFPHTPQDVRYKGYLFTSNKFLALSIEKVLMASSPQASTWRRRDTKRRRGQQLSIHSEVKGGQREGCSGKCDIGWYVTDGQCVSVKGDRVSYSVSSIRCQGSDYRHDIQTLA